MNIDLQKLDKGQVELKVELSSAELTPFLEKVASRISQKVKIEGFRPGKAPLDIVKQKVGEQQVYQEAAQDAVEKTFPQAIIEKNLTTIGPPKIEVLKLVAGNPFLYKATIALVPEIKLGNYKNLKVKKKEVKADEKELTKTLSDLQKSRQKEKVVKREAREGDRVEVDFEIFMDKVPLEEGQSKNIPVFIGEKQFIPGFEEKMIGAKSGDQKEFSLRFPNEYHNKNLAGREAEFKVKVNTIYEIERPELNDDLAKSLGNFKNFQDLEDKLKDNLNEEAKLKEQQRFELALVEEVVSRSEFGEIPDVLVESELEKMIAELKQGIENQGLKFEDYLKQLNKNPEDLKKEFSPQADKRIKTALVIRAIAEKENIKVSDKELAEELQKVISRYQGQEKFLEQAKTDQFKEYLNNIIVNKKVFELLEKISQ